MTDESAFLRGQRARHAALSALVDSMVDAAERAEQTEKVRMTADEILELAKSEDAEPAYDLRTPAGCYAYAKFLSDGPRAGCVNRLRAVLDASVIAGFSGKPVLILVYDNRKAIVPSGYADLCDGNTAPGLRVFGYGGRV